MKHDYVTKDGYRVLRVYEDIQDTEYLTAIIKRPDDLVICRGYNRENGTWNQGFYSYDCEDSAIYALHKIFMNIVKFQPLYTWYSGYYCE